MEDSILKCLSSAAPGNLKTLEVAQRIGFKTKSDVNKCLYKLEKEGRVTKCCDSPPAWAFRAARKATAGADEGLHNTMGRLSLESTASSNSSFEDMQGFLPSHSNHGNSDVFSAASAQASPRGRNYGSQGSPKERRGSSQKHDVLCQAANNQDEQPSTKARHASGQSHCAARKAKAIENDSLHNTMGRLSLESTASSNSSFEDMQGFLPSHSNHGNSDVFSAASAQASPRRRNYDSQASPKERRGSSQSHDVLSQAANNQDVQPSTKVRHSSGKSHCGTVSLAAAESGHQSMPTETSALLQSAQNSADRSQIHSVQSAGKAWKQPGNTDVLIQHNNKLSNQQITTDLSATNTNITYNNVINITNINPPSHKANKAENKADDLLQICGMDWGSFDMDLKADFEENVWPKLNEDKDKLAEIATAAGVDQASAFEAEQLFSAYFQQNKGQYRNKPLALWLNLLRVFTEKECTNSVIKCMTWALEKYKLKRTMVSFQSHVRDCDNLRSKLFSESVLLRDDFKKVKKMDEEEMIQYLFCNVLMKGRRSNFVKFKEIMMEHQSALGKLLDIEETDSDTDSDE